jgi:hypothetical protein
MSDTQMIEERLRSFLRAPDDADWQDVRRRAGETPARAAPRFTRRRMALALAACIAVAVPVVFSGLFRSSQTPAQRSHAPNTRRGGARPLGFMPIKLHFRHGAQGITAIDVTVNASTREANMRLQVLSGNPYGPDSGRRVVFQETVPMTNIKSPADGPPGTVAVSTWSGRLSPSDWHGGCQKALYAVQVQVGMTALSEWFPCRSG